MRQFPCMFPGFMGIAIPCKNQKEWDFNERFNTGLAIFYIVGLALTPFWLWLLT